MGLEPISLAAFDFESNVYTIPPLQHSIYFLPRATLCVSNMLVRQAHITYYFREKVKQFTFSLPLQRCGKSVPENTKVINRAKEMGVIECT